MESIYWRMIDEGSTNTVQLPSPPTLSFAPTAPTQTLFHAPSSSPHVIPTPYEESLLKQIQGLLTSNPNLIHTLRNLVNNPNFTLEPPSAYVEIPDLGDVAVSHTTLHMDGSYHLPPSTFEDAPVLTVYGEALDGLIPFVQQYKSFIKKISEMVSAEEDIKAKKKTVEDLEHTVETNKNLLKILQEQLEKEEKDVKKLDQSLSLKKMKAKLTGKFDEIRQKELQDVEKSRLERESRERAIAEANAKLEKARVGYNLAKGDADGLSNVRFDLKMLLEEAFASFTYPTGVLNTYKSSIRILESALERIEIDRQAIKAVRHLIYLSVKLLNPMVNELLSFTMSPRAEYYPNSPKSIDFRIRHEELAHHLKTMAQVLPEIAKDLPELTKDKIDEVFVVIIHRHHGTHDYDSIDAPASCHATLSLCNKAVKRLKELAQVLTKTNASIESTETSTRHILSLRKQTLAILQMESFECWAQAMMDRDSLRKEQLHTLMPISSFIY
ncbi:hypothetical protein HDU97_002485 [Phlyctochytrium planicorne]|nr:hypothetical protein HDU97_002485 [Phlyctochytrium planicorne]